MTRLPYEDDDTFRPHQYVLDRGWDYGCIEDTASLGVSDADEQAIDAWAGVHGDDYDPPTEEAAEEEAIAVRAAQKARGLLLQYCLRCVAE